jgi:hypothetical protein
MKTKLLLVLWILSGWIVKAQVVITLQLPPLGLTIKPQLWNMALINTTGLSMNGQITMVMSDASTGHTVLTGITPAFLINTGVNNITANMLTPVTYTAGPGYTIDANPAGFLPVGVFNICYTLTRWTNDAGDQISEECITAGVEPISPPQLMSPGDSDQVLLRRPLFTWLPPTPFNTFSNLLYDWTLVEVQPMQSASVAIQQNIPLFFQSNISFTSLQYPLSMAELDTGKVYAWQVTAKNNSSPIANSEIWTFRLQKMTNDTFKINKGSYAGLRRQQDASYVISGPILRYLYTHELSNNSAVQIKITDISNVNHHNVELDSPALQVKYGPNYLELDLSENSAMINHHMYLLELVNERNERWFLKFEYRSAN